jgi:hypothetical protein
MTKSFLFVILFILTSVSSVFAQESEALKNDLGNSFKTVSVVRIQTRDGIAQTGASSRVISISAANKNFELSLTPRDLRSPRYIAEDTSVAGVRRLEKTPVTTYKGKIAGETDSEVRLTMVNSEIEGFFQTQTERFFIEPAKRYSALAAPDEFVVYKAEDVLRNTGFNCPQDLSEKLEDGKAMVTTEGVQAQTGLKTIEIATEADFDFVGTNNNDAAATNSKILSILNMAEGVYERELNLTVSVVFQHTWSTPDSYNGTNSDALLHSFQAYWNTNYPAAQYPRDTAHLFTYKPNVRAQGLAYIGVICNNPSFAYGVSGRVDPSWSWEEANFLITTHEIGHNLGANHSDAMADCGNTLMQAQLNSSTQLTFCSASRAEVNNFVSANGTCLTARSFGGRLDFDGDGKTDIGIFRPSNGEWWLNRSSTSQTVAARFGLSTDKVASGDFTGDGKADVAFFRPSTGEWFILRSEDSSFFSFPFGTTGDVPAPADYDGDGKTDAAVFRPSTGTWFIRQSVGGTAIGQFGQLGDVPVTADYDGDNKSDIAIFRPSVGEWWIQKSTGGTLAFQFGNIADKPVQGDYTGDGKADAAIFRPSNGYWYILRSEDSSFYSVPFGAIGDVPVPGDYDGDGKFDTAVFRPALNTWYINRTTAGTAIIGFGAAGDLPVPNAFVP